MSRDPVAASLATFTFDGKRIPIEPDDTYASALHRAGVLELSRSMKYHRPRGLFCVSGSCASCFVGVDGIPNVPACTTRAVAGAELESQNTMGSAKRDLLAITDKVYRKGFDPHGAFTKPAVLNAAFLKAVRFMSGVGTPPDGSTRPAQTTRHVEDWDEIIIGSGRGGLQRASSTKGDVLLVDEAPHPGGSACHDPSEVDTLALADSIPNHVTVRCGTLAFGIYQDVVALTDGQDLWEVHADRITIAPGRHDAWPLFANNDLPGVLSLRGARRLLHGHKVLPGRRVVSDAPLPEAFTADLQQAGGDVVQVGDVQGVKGGTRVEKALVDGSWVRCDAVVTSGRMTPRVELFQQAGCELGFQDGVLAPRVDDMGRTSRKDVYWAVGT